MANHHPVIKTEHDLHDYCYELFQFLGHFAVDADFDIFDVKHTIKRSYDENNKECYPAILSQANEILAMDPFPYDAIENATNLLISKITDEKKKTEEVKKWLRNVLHLLELRVTGKL